MKLQLVDRRRRTANGLDGGLFPLLAELCEPGGRPGWTVSLVLVDDDQMTELNAEYRRMEGVTDVLSFGYLSGEPVGDQALAAGEGYARTDLWREPLRDEADDPVGEIVLAPGFIRRRCAAEGWQTESEFAMLTVHGMLHILGWEHGDADDAGAMRAAECELLARRGIDHPMTGRGANS